jgi:predicted metal-dependent hydrolase
MGTIRIGNRRIKYNVRKSPDSKYAQLKLKPNLQLEVTIPLDSRIKVSQILKKKRRWIESKSSEILGSRKILDSNRLLYRGAYHRIAFSGSTNRIRTNGSKIILPANNGGDWKALISDWMEAQTRRMVSRRLAHFATELGVSPKGVAVQSTKKWAYCTRSGRLVFNSQLIALPQELSDYVILHEIKDRVTMLKQFIAE